MLLLSIFLLFTTADIISMLFAALIRDNAKADALLNLLKNGYQINQETYDNFQDWYNALCPIWKWNIMECLLLIPGVNILSYIKRAKKYKVAFQESGIIKSEMFPTHESAREEYAEKAKELGKLLDRHDSVIVRKMGIFINDRYLSRNHDGAIRLVQVVNNALEKAQEKRGMEESDSIKMDEISPEEVDLVEAALSHALTNQFIKCSVKLPEEGLRPYEVAYQKYHLEQFSTPDDLICYYIIGEGKCLQLSDFEIDFLAQCKVEYEKTMGTTKDGESGTVSMDSDEASIKMPSQTTDTAVLEEGPTLGKKLK